jgi:uncharacterized membrane protein YdjX (TVP38/TMEM64 family)
MPRKGIPRSAIFNLVLVAVTMGALFFIVRSWGQEALQEWVEHAGVWAPVVLVVAKIATIVFAPLSGLILYSLAGALFGFWKAFALLVLGDAIGGTIAFFISRVFGRSVIEYMLGGEANALGRVLKLIGSVRGFLVTRIIFATAQDLMAYAAGLTQISFVTFFVIHVIVGLAPTAAMTWFGSLLITEQGGFGLGSLIAAIGAVGGLSALAVMWYTGQTLLQEKPENPAKTTP